MKLTIEPRKTMWVPFLDCNAQLKFEWRCRVEYRAYNVRDAATWRARTRYTFSGLAGQTAIPSSQLIIMEQGIPLTVTQTVVSAVKDRFQSEEVDDPFVVITDRVAGLKKSELVEKQLAKGLIERTWVETIERSIKVENKTGKQLQLALTAVDHPADELRFMSAEPPPVRSSPPEYTFDIALAPDQEATLKIVLRLDKSESIRAPRADTPQQRSYPSQNQQLDELEKMLENEDS